jgi:hypothetical protein
MTFFNQLLYLINIESVATVVHLILSILWYNYTTHAKINARFSQARVFSSLMTVIQRDRLAFMLLKK